MTERQQIFLANYLKNHNATQAAIAAGYSENGASVQGSRLLRQPSIAAAVAAHDKLSEKKRQRAVAQAELTAETIMSELRNLVTSSVQDLYDSEGNLKPIHELPAEVAKTISSLEMGDKGGIKKLKTHSKLQAIEIGARILQMVRAERETVVPVQIIVGPAPELPEPTASALLKPEW